MARQEASVSEVFSNKDECDSAGPLSFEDDELADRAPWSALPFHSLILERQRDLSYASKAVLHGRYELVEARDPEHVGWSVHVGGLAAAARVGTDNLARLADRLDAPQVVIGFDRELRPGPGAAGRIALGLPLRVQVPVARGGILQPGHETDPLPGGGAAVGHLRSLRDQTEDRLEGRVTVGGVDRFDASLLQRREGSFDPRLLR